MKMIPGEEGCLTTSHTQKGEVTRKAMDQHVF